MKPFAGSIAPWTNTPGIPSPPIASFTLSIQIAGFRCCCEEWESIPLKWVDKLRNESAQLLRRAETTQRLQSCRGLRRCRLVACSGRDTGFSVPGNSKLGREARPRAGCDRVSDRVGDRVGV